MFSDALVFDGTISENILIGDISASREDMVKAQKKQNYMNLSWDSPVSTKRRWASPA